MSNLRAAVRPYNGVPTIYLNDQPVTGLMHWNRNMEPQDVRNFSDAGVNLYSFLGNVHLEGLDESMVHDGCGPYNNMTPGYIDNMMKGILEGNPDALVIPRFRLQVNDEWIKRNPGKLMRFYNLNSNVFEDGLMATLGNDQWIEEALAALEKSVEYCEKRWGDHIIAYHSGFGHCAEHSYNWTPKVADYHPDMLHQFRLWLSEKYSSIDALQKAWEQTDVTFESAEFPEPECFRIKGPSASSMFSPETDQAAVDMMRFNSEYMAGLVVRQAICVKEILRRIDSQKLFGAFYCYANLPANSASHYADGQDAHQIVLDCQEVDYLSAPVGYSARHPGGVSTGQLQPGSAMLAGKLYFAEDDTGTHLTQNSHNTMAADANQSVQMITRGFLDVWRNGGTQWFMDLHGEGEHRDPEIMAAVKRLSSFASKHLNDRKSTAEVAVFMSDESLSYSKTFDQLTGSLIEQQLNEIASIGASFDIFRIEDLRSLVSADRLKQYKFAIMLNIHVVGDNLRDMVQKYLKTDNRSILWFHAPGIMHNNKFDVERSTELTDIKYVKQEYGRASLITEVLIDGKRFSYGMQRNVYPRLYAADPEAETLGYIVEGTKIPFRNGSDGGTLARKQFPDHCSIWSSSPNMPSNLLTMFAEDAGVHIYCKCGSQVFNTENWIAVHSKWNQTIKIEFPEKVTLYDAFTKQLIVDNSDILRYPVKKGDNLILEKHHAI